jgi:hypothetical protein
VLDMRSLKPAEYGKGMYSILKDEYTGKGINVFLVSYRNRKYTFLQGRESLFARIKRRITSTIVKKWFRGG